MMNGVTSENLYNGFDVSIIWLYSTYQEHGNRPSPQGEGSICVLLTISSYKGHPLITAHLICIMGDSSVFTPDQD